MFEYTDQQSKQWSSETLNFQTSDDGQYKVVFESETSANSYGALLDDIKLETLDNIGYEDSYIALSDIVVGLVDTDGSESLTTHLDLSAFPSGTVVKAPMVMISPRTVMALLISPHGNLTWPSCLLMYQSPVTTH